MKSAGVNVSVGEDGEVVVTTGTFEIPGSHREVVFNGMILTMEHEIKKIIQHYKRFTEQGTVLNNQEKANEF
jgi:hypothetical protein